MEERSTGSGTIEESMAAPPHAPRLSEGFAMGDWWIRPQEGALERGGERRSLSFQKMEILVYLAARQGHVVAKDEIYEAIWCDAVVEETALPRCISEIRRTLDDDASNPRYIRTVPKRGYSVIPTVTFRSSKGESTTKPTTCPEPTSSPAQAVEERTRPQIMHAWTLALVVGMGLGAFLGGYVSSRYRGGTGHARIPFRCGRESELSTVAIGATA